MANGFANRFLLGCVRRAQLLPHGGNFQERDRQLLGKRTLEALTAARTIARVQMTEETRERWNAEYPALVKSGTNLTDHMTARAEAQVIRLALIYALLDQAAAIELAHLEPALALWRFCQASTRYVFGELTGDAVGDVILRALQAGRKRRADEDGHHQPVRPPPRRRQDRCRLGPIASCRQSRQPADWCTPRHWRPTARNVVRQMSARYRYDCKLYRIRVRRTAKKGGFVAIRSLCVEPRLRGCHIYHVGKNI